MPIGQPQPGGRASRWCGRVWVDVHHAQLPFPGMGQRSYVRSIPPLAVPAQPARLECSPAKRLLFSLTRSARPDHHRTRAIVPTGLAGSSRKRIPHETEKKQLKPLENSDHGPRRTARIRGAMWHDAVALFQQASVKPSGPVRPCPRPHHQPPYRRPSSGASANSVIGQCRNRRP